MAAEITRIDDLSLRFDPRPWPFANKRRAMIDANFARARQEKPQLWNGQVLVMHDHRFDRRRLEGRFLSTDFASFLSWRDWGFPEAGVINCFSMGALRSADGAWLMGVMSAQTSAGGKIYFPAGTPDLADVVDGVVDLEGSVIREVGEEAGLTSADFTAESGWYAVVEGARIALMKVLHTRERADVLRHRIIDFLGRETMPELADVRVVRSRSDIDAMMPSFVVAFVEHLGLA